MSAPCPAVERKPYTPPMIQARPGFDPANCSPEQWAAIVWLVRLSYDCVAVVDEPVADWILRQLVVTSSRISAEDPRTGDMVEDVTGRRYWYVDSKPERIVKDSVLWSLLCRMPDVKTFFGGCPT